MRKREMERSPSPCMSCLFIPTKPQILWWLYIDLETGTKKENRREKRGWKRWRGEEKEEIEVERSPSPCMSCLFTPTNPRFWCGFPYT
jgi:hypothetical protein